MSKNISTHIFLYYESTGKYVLETVSKFYNGPVYLSLIENNCSNDILIELAKGYFEDIRVLYVDNYGTDQYGFYHTLKLDDTNTPWIFYCHDKHQSKMNWLKDLLEVYKNMDQNLLGLATAGIISSKKHKYKQSSFDDILSDYANVDHSHRKDSVQSMHTLIWLHELERILLTKHELGDKSFKYPVFSAGNIFLIRRDVALKAHDCVYEEFFNKGVYRTDGEIGHGLERFYFYVSQAMGYNNLFI